MPTARDIPPVSLTDVPHVDAAYFKSYISRVDALYTQMHTRDREEESWTTRGDKQGDGPVQNAEGYKAGEQPYTMQNSLITSITSIPAPAERSSLRRGSGSSGHKPQYSTKPLSVIPKVYFDEVFHLENPRTFDVVTERCDIIPWASSPNKTHQQDSPAPRKALATNAILQEKLSWYIDVVELHLANSISIASATFSSALWSLCELHLEMAESVEKIKALRKDITLLDQEVAIRGIELAQKRRKHHNLQQLNDAVLQLKQIVTRVIRCESLVDEGEIEKAFVEIDAIELLMSGERDEALGPEALSHIQVRDLRGAVALQGVASDLATLRSRLGKVLEFEVHSLLIEDLRRHIQSISTQEVLLRWEAASLRAKGAYMREASAFPSYMGMTDELRTALLPHISGLHRSRSISSAMQAYRDLVLQEIRSIVRNPLPSSNEDTDSVMSASTSTGSRKRTTQEKSSILARNLRALDVEDAEKLLSTIYIGITETLRRLKTQSTVLLDIASTLCKSNVEGSHRSSMLQLPTSNHDTAANAATFEIQEEMHLALDLSNLLGQAVDLSHDKVIKILRVRSEQVRSLSLADFLHYFTLNRFFADECEAISGRAGTSFKTVVNDQIKDFVEAYEYREIQILAQGMDADNWQETDFTAEDQMRLKYVCECSTLDPTAWAGMRKSWAPSSQETEEAEGREVSEVGDKAQIKVRRAIIDDETFLLPRSAVLCVEGVLNFLQFIDAIPTMTLDIGASLVSYLRMFDSRCRQLILGAGATHTANLKRITTRNLALASQALLFIAGIIPYIREFVRRQAPSNPSSPNILREFDKVRRDLQEQHDAIYNKLVEIMDSRVRLLSRKVRETQWSKQNTGNARRNMEDLAKDTTKLYSAITKYLPQRGIELVMMPVFTSYKNHLGQAFKEADPETETGRDCMFHDVRTLVSEMAKIEGSADLGAYLIKIIEGKKVNAT